MLDLSFQRETVAIRHQFHKFVTVKGPAPKNSRKWRSSVPREPIYLPALFWMSFPTKRKSLAVGFVILFCLLLLPLSMCEGQGGFYGGATIDKRGGRAGRRCGGKCVIDDHKERERIARSVTWGEIRQLPHVKQFILYVRYTYIQFICNCTRHWYDIFSTYRPGRVGIITENPFSWCFIVTS